MAQTLYTHDIDPDFPIALRSMLTNAALVHEPETDNPYVGVFVRAQASSAESLLTRGRLEIVAEYTDGTETTLTDSDAPFEDVSIPTTDSWFLVHGNGQVQTHADPTATATLTYSATAANNEQLRLDTSKVLRAISYYWTDND